MTIDSADDSKISNRGRFENFESDHRYESNLESDVRFEIESNHEASQVPTLHIRDDVLVPEEKCFTNKNNSTILSTPC